MNHQQIRAFFALNHTRPKKHLGQNFLINPEALKIILEAGALTAGDTVIEIGAGLGCLTEVLVQHAERVIAIEVDELLYNALASHFGITCSRDEITLKKHPSKNPLLQKSTDPRVQLLNADVLKLEFNSLLVDGNHRTVPTTFKVIANLPYSVTTPILWKLLPHHKQIHSCVLMMQKEVAERIVAGPGGKTYGALTIGVAYYAEATLIATLSPENFYPAPKVDSALLKLKMRETPKVAVDSEDFFFKIVRTAFRTRRKMLKNALARGGFASGEVLAAAFDELGIAPQRRAETLDITEFAALANFLSQSVSAKTSV
ncbi:16S rRNA (adenine(1518)-N(6)/adenine(1519)-N(6))-dimethyltransferase RsmA [Candidatus Poribacteria bacterium]|nr:16S rRNA (adenine(1518)-N(6)/adenine(1519)-N(6))-dimethyltransferase RsmA [Candidatus Poribacteria bacterium]MYG05598.1 16S rRNA (adenine(1518)-N(6)/adenine(1519)-N(6))-dimethyltransferase RsmA [Candidatus Poribacteria bacterium]MYK25258.1 16S rRNA (adenine(1518)-N(6)/adenine(1519)-N(6))-dimethyltransferase RsmA [Candidatus Poribacteria bacterium]